jgi:hypothetical protein
MTQGALFLARREATRQSPAWQAALPYARIAAPLCRRASTIRAAIALRRPDRPESHQHAEPGRSHFAATPRNVGDAERKKASSVSQSCRKIRQASQSSPATPGFCHAPRQQGSSFVNASCIFPGAL